MATWASLSSAQQTTVINHLAELRDIAGHMGRLVALAHAAGLEWSNTVQPIVSTLDATPIPIDNGVQGAQLLAPADITNLAGLAINFSDPNNSTGTPCATPFWVALYIKAAGVYNTLQQGHN